jgi:hypothetical protein
MADVTSEPVHEILTINPEELYTLGECIGGNCSWLCYYFA